MGNQYQLITWEIEASGTRFLCKPHRQKLSVVAVAPVQLRSKTQKLHGRKTGDAYYYLASEKKLWEVSQHAF